MVQPRCSSPSNAVAGTRTSSKNTWFSSWSPERLMIGRTLMPGRPMSNSKKLMPCWALPDESVRTRQKILLAHCAWVVQILLPLMTKPPPCASGNRTARHCNEARSEPAPGSL